jgi:Xaa-Pro aminopeptidase
MDLHLRIFSDHEMRRRGTGVFARIPKEIDTLLVHTADNVFYLSGVPLLSEWGRPMWCLLRRDGTGVSIGAQLEGENMEANSFFDDIRTYADDENVWEASIGLVRDVIESYQGLAAGLGAEVELLTTQMQRTFTSALPKCDLFDAGSALAETRLIKSQEEIDLLRLGGQVAKIGAQAFLAAQHEGVSEITVASHAVAEMERAIGALAPNALSSTYAYCQSGVRTLTPHLHATGYPLRRGEVVALNVFPVISGYCMELERTYVLGEPTRLQYKALEAVGEAFDVAKEALRPGLPMSEVDEVARGALERKGFGPYRRHGTGHAHGIMIGAAGREELGELRRYNHRELSQGMVCSVEPGVYIPGVGGFRHSDVMLVTDQGAECLTEFPRRIGNGSTEPER